MQGPLLERIGVGYLRRATPLDLERVRAQARAFVAGEHMVQA